MLLNLVANARDAMSEGGQLRISTRARHYAPEQRPPVEEMRPGTWAMFAISDTGEGMSAEDAESAFKPYFTTRGAARTGLGLATVRGIVRDARGFIDADTDLDDGTTVTVYLPAAEVDSDREPPTVEEQQPDRPALLLVEDEEGLRLSLRELLKSSPCEIYEAGSAEEALAVASDIDGPDLLITDVVLPGADGYDLADRLEEDESDLEVVFMSGYTDEVTDRSGEAANERRRFIQKPFDPEALLALVEELLADGQR